MRSLLGASLAFVGMMLLGCGGAPSDPGGGGGDGGGGDGGGAAPPSSTFDCDAFIRKLYQCGAYPPEEEALGAEANIARCEIWSRSLLPDVLIAYRECADECTLREPGGYNQCVYDAGALCDSEAISMVESNCQKVFDCGFSDVSPAECAMQCTEPSCGVFGCFTPDALAAATACQDVACESYTSCVTDAGII